MVAQPQVAVAFVQDEMRVSVPPDSASLMLLSQRSIDSGAYSYTKDSTSRIQHSDGGSTQSHAIPKISQRPDQCALLPNTTRAAGY
ncbi:hypothetical protein BST61_g8347 [Cercospora zeina]